MKDIFWVSAGGIAGLLLVLYAGCACNRMENGGSPEGEEDRRSELKCLARAVEDSSQKSMFSGGENDIRDINIWCYLDGSLDACVYSDGSSAALRLYSGREYHIYALANLGRQEPPVLEDGLPDLELPLTTSDEEGGFFPDGLPMACGCTVYPATASAGRLVLGMERLVAKYRLKIRIPGETKSSLSSVSVRIRNAASSVAPFRSGNSTGSVTTGDLELLNSLTDGSEATLYIPENIRGDELDEEHCSFIEIKGRLSYADRPSSECAYILEQDMSYRWYLKDARSGDFSVTRNTAYTAEFSWSDFGWIPDVENVNIDKVAEDQTYMLSFCDREGVPVSDAVFESGAEDDTVSIYWRVYPESSSPDVVFSTSVPPAGALLTLLEEGVGLGDGIYRTSYLSESDRSSTSDMQATVKNAVKGISCTACYHFKGTGNCVAEWEKDDDEFVNF